jgi:hypothetical protein
MEVGIRKRRRPSAALIVAVIALFVALGGPAQAAHLINGKLLKRGSVTGKAIKDHSIGFKDLTKKSVRRLQSLPAGSVTEAKIANGAITPGKLSPGAVGSAAIAPGGVSSGNLATGAVGSGQVADNSLTGADIADGGLSANDIGRFWGQFSVNVPAVPKQSCWSGEPVGLAPERAHANINKDVVMVTPGAQWPDKQLSLTVRQSGNVSRFVLIGCNPTSKATEAATVLFNYVVIDVP